MSAHNTLSRVVDLEAIKLLKRAEGAGSLSDEDLSALEVLSRCAKALKPENEAPKDTSDGKSDAELLEALK